MPFSSIRRNDVLYLSLDTPNCAVNIFNRDTARQLLDIMGSISPANTRAVVFQSAKPGSFINGVGLLLAHAATTPEALLKAVDGPRQAYQAVRSASVPTIAAVQGTCWGCGVEFVLNCEYRIAADTYDTHFYMTEINDYLFITFFGAAQRLPQAIGLERTINFLLWGERWSANVAAQRGLTNEVAEDHCFDEQVENFVERVLRREVHPAFPHTQRYFWGPKEEEIVTQTKARIAQLPPAYHKVYLECLDLIIHGAKKGEVDTQDLDREALKSAESAACEIGKSAFSFFYLRQMAEELCLKGTKEFPARYQLSFRGHDPSFVRFQQDLTARRLKEVAVTNGASQPVSDGSAHLAFVSHQPSYDSQYERESAIAVSLQLNTGTVNGWPMVLYNPLYSAESRFFELALNGENPTGFQIVVRYLTRAGFQVAISRPRETFSLNLLLSAYLRPLVVYCLIGGTPETINFTLRQFGFVRRPHHLLGALDGAALLALLSSALGTPWPATDLNAACRQLQEPSFEGGAYDENIIDALCLSLLAATQQCLTERRFHHPSLIDLAVREVLDFPLQHRSLCFYLTKTRMKLALERCPSQMALLSDDDRAHVEAFLATGKRFYL